METLQGIFTGIGTFFSAVFGGVAEVFTLWIASTTDARSIIQWFVFALVLVAGLGVVPRLINDLVVVVDQEQTRRSSALLKAGPVRVITIAAVALLLAASAADVVRTLLSAPA